MRHSVLLVGAVLVLTGSARAGKPIPLPKAPLTTQGYTIRVTTKVAPASKIVLPKSTKVPVVVKLTLPKLTRTSVHPPRGVNSMVKPVTRIQVRASHLSLGSHGASSISLLRDALLSGTSFGEPTVRRRVPTEWRARAPVKQVKPVKTRTVGQPRRVARSNTPVAPSLLQTLQYQFDLVQMSEALGK